MLKGTAMGIAEVIPGVSGGTIAFITGIYERLLACIRSIHPSLIEIYRSDGWYGVWRKLDGSFLIFLLGGMVVGFISGVFGVTYLLEEYPSPVWGFFFGLIVASCIYIARQIPKWSTSLWLSLVLGCALAYYITTVTPVEGSTSPVMVFVAGMIAISALILPGISGSFILLLMGMYTIIYPAIKSVIQHQELESLMIVSIFGAGCLVGLYGFSRVLSWLLDQYKYLTFAALIGFMLGSLNKIWPWRNPTFIMDKGSGEVTKLFDPRVLLDMDPEGYKVLTEVNVLPVGYDMGDPYTTTTAICGIIGFVLVLLLDSKSKS